MLRRLAITTCVLSGLWCLLGLADRWNWMRWVWDRVLPQAVLARPLSPTEAQVAEVEKRIAALRQEFAVLDEKRASRIEKRRELIAQLHGQTGLQAGVDARQLMTDNPITSALVRSIDAEDQRTTELDRQLAILKSEITRLDAKLIALRNGASLVGTPESVRPSDDLQPEGTIKDAKDRFERIVREAIEYNQQIRRSKS